MAFSAFADKAHQPESREVAETLGRSAAAWDELRRRVAEAWAPIDEAWVWGGANGGWTLRLKQKKRAVLYMTPCEGFFRANFALGEKAVAAARELAISPEVMEVVEASPKYVEGRAVRIEVRAKARLKDVLALAQAKMST